MSHDWNRVDDLYELLGVGTKFTRIVSRRRFVDTELDECASAPHTQSRFIKCKVRVVNFYRCYFGVSLCVENKCDCRYLRVAAGAVRLRRWSYGGRGGEWKGGARIHDNSLPRNLFWTFSPQIQYLISFGGSFLHKFLLISKELSFDFVFSLSPPLAVFARFCIQERPLGMTFLAMPQSDISGRHKIRS